MIPSPDILPSPPVVEKTNWWATALIVEGTIGLAAFVSALLMHPGYATHVVTMTGTIVTATIAANVKKETKENNQRIQEVHVSINSRLTELLRASSAAAHAEGRAEGVASQAPTPAVDTASALVLATAAATAAALVAAKKEAEGLQVPVLGGSVAKPAEEDVPPPSVLPHENGGLP